MIKQYKTFDDLETMNEFLSNTDSDATVVSFDPIVVEIGNDLPNVTHDMLLRISCSVDRLVEAVNRIASSMQYRR